MSELLKWVKPNYASVKTKNKSIWRRGHVVGIPTHDWLKVLSSQMKTNATFAPVQNPVFCYIFEKNHSKINLRFLRLINQWNLALDIFRAKPLSCESCKIRIQWSVNTELYRAEICLPGRLHPARHIVSWSHLIKTINLDVFISSASQQTGKYLLVWYCGDTMYKQIEARGFVLLTLPVPSALDDPTIKKG